MLLLGRLLLQGVMVHLHISAEAEPVAAGRHLSVKNYVERLALAPRLHAAPVDIQVEEAARMHILEHGAADVFLSIAQ